MGGGGEVSLLNEVAGSLVCVGAFDCNLDFDNYGGIVLWLLIMVYMFKALGVICDEYFVPSLEVIVEKLKLSNDVAGATFMAAGSSAPEFFTSLVATFVIVSEGGVGTIVGSAIFNILVIVGLTAYVACAKTDLRIWWYPLTRDTFFYSLAIVEIVIALLDEEVKWYEGLLMLVTYIFYCIYMKLNPMIIEKLNLGPADVTAMDPLPEVTLSKIDWSAEEAKAAAETPDGSLRKAAAANEDTVPGPPDHHLGITEGEEGAHHCCVGAPEEAPPEKPAKPPITEDPPNPEGRPATLVVHETFQPRPSWSLTEAKAMELELKLKNGEFAVKGEELEEAAANEAASDRSAERRCRCRDPMLIFMEYTMPTTKHYWLLFSLSIWWIGVATYVMVDATDRVGKILYIPRLAMARVFLAAGTSIPDALGSIAVAKQGEGDMAVSNALGSNVFDILIGLGIPWMVKTGFMGKEVSFKGKLDELVYDIIALVIVLVLFVGALVVHRWYLTRTVGILLLAFYVIFLIYNILAVYAFKIVEVDDT